jgi:hypothetical protein
LRKLCDESCRHTMPTDVPSQPQWASIFDGGLAVTLRISFDASHRHGKGEE